MCYTYLVEKYQLKTYINSNNKSKGWVILFLLKEGEICVQKQNLKFNRITKITTQTTKLNITFNLLFLADKEASDAEAICKHLGIEFRHVNFVKEYWNDVFTGIYRIIFLSKNVLYIKNNITNPYIMFIVR